MASGIYFRSGFAFQLTHLLRGATWRAEYIFVQDSHFNSRTSCEVRHGRLALVHHGLVFQLTHLLRGATCCADSHAWPCRYFNSRTSCEVRRFRRIHWGMWLTFQLTHLLRGATLTFVPNHEWHQFQLTHLLRGATPTAGSMTIPWWISTHAPLARCDAFTPIRSPKTAYFNSRTSCEVRRHPGPHQPALCDFNSRTSCEVRHGQFRGGTHARKFQLTHLLRGATRIPGGSTILFTAFQLTHLLRGATGPSGRSPAQTRHFNSRTSCEVRRGAIFARRNPNISTHAPLARCDIQGLEAQGYTVKGDFNSRTSCEVRPHAMQAKSTPNNFNSRTSCEVRPPQQLENPVHANFNSRTSCEVRRG